jgi:hypothetical protein
MKLIRARHYGIFDLEGSVVSLRSLNKFDIPQIEINSLLFQTGYLTIKKWNDGEQAVTLDFPNKEVANAEGYVYIVEFKLGDAESALAQIKGKGYHQKYLGAGKKLVLVGIGFDVEERNVGGFLVEQVR